MGKSAGASKRPATIKTEAARRWPPAFILIRLRCLVSYRALGHLAALVRRRELDAVDAAVAVATRVLDRLEATVKK
jgi:hypothetical protein